MYQEKSDRSFDWFMLVMLVLLGGVLMLQQFLILSNAGSLMRFR